MQLFPPFKLDSVKTFVQNQLAQTRGRSVVAIDSFKELAVANGFKWALKFIQELQKICFEHASNLLIMVDPEAFTKQQLAEIEKAFS